METIDKDINKISHRYRAAPAGERPLFSPCTEFGRKLGSEFDDLNDRFDCIQRALNPVSRAKARRIRRLNGKTRQVLWNIDYCFDIAKQWNKLTPVQKIMLEENGTTKLLELLKLYNRYVGHSIHYRLREKTSEEEEG